MDSSGDVVWLGRPAPWAGHLGGPVRAVETADALVAASGGAALAVVGAEHVGDVGDWLRRPRGRPPVLVVLDRDGPEAEDAALRAHADEVTTRAAPPEAARRAARRAAGRHAAVRRDADLYRLMVEHATDAIVLADDAGRAVYASPATEAQTGFAPAALVGGEPFATVHPDDRARVAAAYAEGLGSDAPGAVQYRSVGPDGRERVLESVGRAVAAPDGRTYGVTSTRDVTARVQIEGRLRDSEARYRAVVGALPDVVSRIRHDGHVLGFHVPAVFETEFPAEALLGRRLQDVVPAELARKFEAAVARVRETGEGVSYDYTVPVGGADRHREVRLAPLGDGEVISMLRDVTALREQGAALERSRAELRALATHLQDVREEERARLSREVHDVLGQALTAVRLGVGWFGRRYPDDDAAQERLAETRATIDETIGHVRQIAADLRPGVLDDFGLASAAEWQTRRFEDRSGVATSLTVRGADEPAPDVATAAFRVLQEALTNVARHAGASSVAVALDLEGGAVRLVVADDGRGIDRAAVGRRTLGLLGMRERAGALGGALDVRATPGGGTTVECTFPAPTPPGP